MPGRPGSVRVVAPIRMSATAGGDAVNARSSGPDPDSDTGAVRLQKPQEGTRMSGHVLTTAGRRRVFARIGAVAVAIAALALLTGSAGAAGKAPGPTFRWGPLVGVQLLAFNDYHGYLETSSNPGPGNVGSDPAGGGEFLAAKLKQLRAGKTNSLTVAAGDLIGGSPVPVRPLPRRALGRVAERHGARRVERRQPRVRRRRHRAAAHAERGLPPRRRLLLPGQSVRGRRVPVVGRQHRQRRHRRDTAAAVLDRGRRRREGRLHRHDARGHRHARRAIRYPGLELPRRGRDGERSRARAEDSRA